VNELLSSLEERTGENLSDVKLSDINAYIKQNTLEVILVCPESRFDELNKRTPELTKALAEILSTTFKVRLKVKKSYFDEAFFTYNLLEFLANHPIIKNNVKSGSFIFEYTDDGVRVKIEVPSTIADYITARKILDQINAYAFTHYCEKIVVELKPIELESEEIVFELPETKLVYDYEGGRKIKVENVEPFIGEIIYEKPSYIVDAKPTDGIVLCGRIKEFTERKRTPKEGDTEDKFFFKFRLEDFTGSVDCIYFPSKKTLDKIRLLRDGKEVVVYGAIEMNTFRGVTSMSLRVRYISLCTLPEEFKINRAKMSLPEKYTCIFPQPYESFEQDDIFRQADEIPRFLLNKEFVVYDFEATGLLNENPRIVEIGAVKIKDGVITETFECLVDPECLIPPKSTEVHGITDAMVKGKPTIKDVMPDFFKFCYGCIMVGQNTLNYDWPLLRGIAEPMNIYFENEQLDVMVLAKKYHPEFAKYNLGYMAKQFGFVNEEAHRALSDTVTTAKVFKEISKKM